MFKLILHHTYKLAGEAVDISHNGNHGFRTATSYNHAGRFPDSGTLQFANNLSSVVVPSAPLWQNLRAVKIETWVKLSTLGQRRNLVEGELAFAFFIHPDGVLWGTFLGPAAPNASPTWHGANSDTIYSPDGLKHTVPLNVWTKLTYIHDGVSSLRIYIDDTLVGANYDLVSPIPSVTAGGIHIGHWPGGNAYTFRGEIDEVKIWRYDPDAAYKQFFCRSMDSKQLACWKVIFDNMASILRDKRQRDMLLDLMRCFSKLQEGLVRDIRSKGEKAIKINDEFSRRYQRLWCRGDIAGRGMKKFVQEWVAWISSLLGRDYLMTYRRQTEACWREFGDAKNVFTEFGERLAKCDPQFAMYLDILSEVTTGQPLRPRQERPWDRFTAIPQTILDSIAKVFSRRHD